MTGTLAHTDCREECAKLVDAMLTKKPYRDQPWAKIALVIAARAIRRGRHLTEKEQMKNLLDSMAECDSDCVSHKGLDCDCGAVAFKRSFEPAN